MMWSGKDCTTSSAVYTECRNSLSWSKKNYCQLSCYNAGLGYDGDQCCTSTSPTLSPTQESSCEFCSNDAPFWLIWKGKDCTTSSDVYTECSNSWYWSINNYCQESCYKAGLGYDIRRSSTILSFPYQPKRSIITTNFARRFLSW